jgi:hypothetical protein
LVRTPLTICAVNPNFQSAFDLDRLNALTPAWYLSTPQRLLPRASSSYNIHGRRPTLSFPVSPMNCENEKGIAEQLEAVYRPTTGIRISTSLPSFLPSLLIPLLRHPRTLTISIIHCVVWAYERRRYISKSASAVRYRWVLDCPIFPSSSFYHFYHAGVASVFLPPRCARTAFFVCIESRLAPTPK